MTKEEKQAAKKEKQALYAEIAAKKIKLKEEKLARKKREKEEYANLMLKVAEIKKQHINKIKEKKMQIAKDVTSNKITKKQGREMFLEFQKASSIEFNVQQQKLLDTSSEELRSGARFRFRRWFFGLGKEFSRVTWMNWKLVLYSLIVIVIIGAILAAAFFGIDYLVGKIPIA